MNRGVMLSASPSSLMRGMEQFILSGALPTIQRVEWLDADVSCTNGTVIKLPKPFIGMSDVDLGLWRYKCQHEIGHESPVNNNPHWKKVMEANRKAHPSKILWSIANLMSDHVQERNQLGEYYGRDGILLNGRELFMKHMLMPNVDTSQKMGQLFMHDALKRAGWNPYITLYPARHDDAFLSQVEACGDWEALRNEGDVFELAQEVFKLFDEEAEAEKERAEAGDDSEDGDGEEGDGECDSVKQAKACLPSAHVDQDAAVERAMEEASEDEEDRTPRITIKDDGTRATVDKARRMEVRKPTNMAFGKRRW